MRFSIQHSNLTEAMRKAGYHPEIKRRSGEISYVRSISKGDFPRFHVYGNEKNGKLEISLHIDQKAPVYEGASAHAGEYEGTVVEKESERIKKALAAPPALKVEDSFLE